MLLELITGRRPVDPSNDVMEDSLVDWARPLIDHALSSGDYRQLLDPRLEGNYAPQELASMVACAGACTRHSARRRPKMGQVKNHIHSFIFLFVFLLSPTARLKSPYSRLVVSYTTESCLIGKKGCSGTRRRSIVGCAKLLEQTERGWGIGQQCRVRCKLLQR